MSFVAFVAEVTAAYAINVMEYLRGSLDSWPVGYICESVSHIDDRIRPVSLHPSLLEGMAFATAGCSFHPRSIFDELIHIMPGSGLQSCVSK